jgi:uncharacterized protein
MNIFIVAIAVFSASVLTFFSAFGLGTILLPVFAIFFPADIAVALTGVVHFFNSLFKAFLTGRNADRRVLLTFGIPAVIAAFAGAWVLSEMRDMPGIFSYRMGGHIFTVTPLNLVISLLLLIFVLGGIMWKDKNLYSGEKSLVTGGILSGFFGGLSGLQGAIRSAFLMKSGLTKESYIATAVIISLFVDITRLSVYTTRFRISGLHESLLTVTVAIAAALAGAWTGRKLLPSVSLSFIENLITVFLLLTSIALAIGFI